MKVISLKQKDTEQIQPIDLIDSSLFYISKSTSVFPVSNFTIYEKKGARTKAIHTVQDGIEFPYEFPYLSYATRTVSSHQVYYTFYRFHLISKLVEEIGTVHYPADVELEGIFMTSQEVMYYIRKVKDHDEDDEITYYLFDAKKQKDYVLLEHFLANSISTPTVYEYDEEWYLVFNPFYLETWEKEDLYRKKLTETTLPSEEFISIIPLKQFIKEAKAGTPISGILIEEKKHDGFVRVIAENGDSIFYVRKNYLDQKEELVELSKQTFAKKSYPLPTGFSYHSIRVFNEHVYFVSTEEDYFYSPIKKEIFRIDHTYFEHLIGVMNVYVHYVDHQYIVADCWTRNNQEDRFYVAVVDKENRSVMYFDGKSLGCEVFDQTVVIY
ncbi:hypothetical protein ACFSCX_01770 [Bacillus salitolerans]|uniref:Uncharacterized protein n=1 Tax=Bacillus salitolerans TaxID=1437434 RepID=A0ABW4LLA8_9BACI